MRKVRHILEDPSPCEDCTKYCKRGICIDWERWFRQRWPIACDLVRVRINEAKTHAKGENNVRRID